MARILHILMSSSRIFWSTRILYIVLHSFLIRFESLLFVTTSFYTVIAFESYMSRHICLLSVVFIRFLQFLCSDVSQNVITFRHKKTCSLAENYLGEFKSVHCKRICERIFICNVCRNPYVGSKQRGYNRSIVRVRTDEKTTNGSSSRHTCGKASICLTYPPMCSSELSHTIFLWLEIVGFSLLNVPQLWLKLPIY